MFNKTTIAEEVQEPEEVFQEHLQHIKDPEFTANSAFYEYLPEDPVLINFLSIFLDKGFYNCLTHQTKLYAAQYL